MKSSTNVKRKLSFFILFIIQISCIGCFCTKIYCPSMHEIRTSNLSQDSIEYITVYSFNQNGRFDQLLDSTNSQISYRNIDKNEAVFYNSFRNSNPLKLDYIVKTYSYTNTLKKVLKIKILQTSKNECNKGCDSYEIPFKISVNDSIYINNIEGFNL